MSENKVTADTIGRNELSLDTAFRDTGNMEIYYREHRS